MARKGGVPANHVVNCLNSSESSNMPAALDRSYDGIIIGAGHHGLVLGSYLARCGLDILLVDRRLHI
jgi:ribulose 1,5-bisphosphate synthetase/thiazole synthase